jgi:Fe-S oxidoreductase/nitrate reductase gamma subunit
MEATREIYWNIGHGVVLPMYLLFAATVAAFCWGFRQRIRVYRCGLPLDRTSNPLRRLVRAASLTLAQLRVMRKSSAGFSVAGIFHAGFFWCFLLLTAGTALIMLQADLTEPLFGLIFLKGAFYKAYSLTLDLAGLVVMAALAVFFVRRFFFKPQGLKTSREDYLALVLLLLILLTGYLVEGARMAATELQAAPELARFSPAGLLAAQALAVPPEALPALHQTFWWVHLALSFALIGVIPFTKLRHLFLIPANYFFSDMSPAGALKTLDLTDENAESFGTEKVRELTWKDLFDADACVSCKRCQDECPAHATGKSLSPMKVVQDLRGAAFAGPDTDIIEAVTEKALWACTTCRACEQACPAAVEHVGKIIDMRRNLTLMKGRFAGEECRATFSNLEVNKNPFGLPPAERADWAAGLAAVKPLAEDSAVEIIYFAGCYASYDKRNRTVATQFMEICAHAGVKVGMLGKQERCCGEPARKLGNEYLYQELAAENVTALNSYGAKRIVTACPHCRHTLGVHYKDLGLQAEVIHHSVFIKELLDAGRLKLKPEAFDFTYHDPCYLSRYAGVIEDPRAVLRAAGGRLTEMEHNKAGSFCCGGGGGRAFLEEQEGTKISARRVEMALATNMPVVATNCPFCITLLEDGVKTSNNEAGLRVRDLAELVADRLA